MKNVKYFPNYLLISLLIVGMCFLEFRINIMSYVYITFVLISLTASIETNIFIIGLLSPLNRVILFGNSSLTLIPVVISIVVLKSILNRSFTLNKTFSLLFLSLLIISFLSSILFMVKPWNSLFYFIFLIFSYIISNVKDEQIYRKFGISFITGYIISIFGGIFFPLVSNIVQNFRYSEHGFYRFMGLLQDPTEFAQKGIVALGFLMTIPPKEKKAPILFSFFSFIFIVIYLIKAGTRSILIGLIILVLYMSSEVNKRFGKNNLQKIILSFFTGLIFILGFYFFVFTPLISLRSGATEVFFSERISIWKVYLSNFFSNPRIFLFGIGAGNILQYSNDIYFVSLHNGLLEIIFEFGIYGTPILIYLLLKHIVQYDKYSLKFSTGLPLLLYLTTLFSLGITRSELFFLLISISFYTIRKDFKFTKNTVITTEK